MIGVFTALLSSGCGRNSEPASSSTPAGTPPGLTTKDNTLEVSTGGGDQDTFTIVKTPPNAPDANESPFP
jgi:hypothetical protein